jgi:outer membrane lipoprotein-sorting protein
VPFSGRVVQTSRLGLPSVPGLDALASASGSTDTLALLTGSHNGQVWYASPDQVRLSATIGSDESDLIRNGRDVWVWQSSDRTVQHAKLPADTDAALASPAPTLTPQELADRALAAVSPTTEVTVDGTARVAGRDAYELVLRPKASGSLVKEVRLALDSENYTPLRVQVFSTKSSEPALEVSFSSITFATPEASVFQFTMPSGGTLKEMGSASVPDAPKPPAGLGDGVTTTGADWTTVAELPAGSAPGLGAVGATPAAGASGSLTSGALGSIRLGTPVSGTWGKGTLIETNLVSVLALEDGRVFVGAVTPELLEQRAGS